jgi:hypothetical protein
MYGCVYVWVCVSVGFVMCVCFHSCVGVLLICILYLLCFVLFVLRFCIVSFTYIYSYLFCLYWWSENSISVIIITIIIIIQSSVV